MSKRLSQTDQSAALLYHARAATPFFSRDGQPCASIPASIDSRRVLLLRSADFRDWLTANYYSEFESAPSSTALRVVLRTLEARAQYGESPEQKVDRRVSFEGDPYAPSKLFLDLANKQGEILEITSQGWGITDNLRHSFCQSSSTLELPAPPKDAADNHALDEFAALFRLTPTARIRVFLWLIAALRPIGPYPILVLRGPASSGKSLLARALRALIDPSTVPLRRLPPRDRELLHLALNNWILVFDSVQRIPAKISEALCAIASGDALEIAQPDAREAASIEIARPILLSAAVDDAQSPWNPPRSLANRSLVVDLASIEAPGTEAAVWLAFEALRAAALGMLAAGVSSALRRIREIDVGNVARFPDSAAWAAAAAPGLGLDPECIAENIADPASMWTGFDPLRDALHKLLGTHAIWSGDASALLVQLRRVAPNANLPGTPTRLTQALARISDISSVEGTGARGRRTLSINVVSPSGAPKSGALHAPYRSSTP